MLENNDNRASAALVHVCRKENGEPKLEHDWKLVRIEPETGNAVCERNGARIVLERSEFEKLNFPGADYIWETISKAQDDADLKTAQETWAKLDLGGVVSAFLRYARRLDPAFAGIQTLTDLKEKTEETQNACIRSMFILSQDVKRVKIEYNRCPARTAFECDQKDDLLARWRHLEDQYDARKYRCETLIPAWRKLIVAIENMDNAAKKINQTSP